MRTKTSITRRIHENSSVKVYVCLFSRNGVLSTAISLTPVVSTSQLHWSPSFQATISLVKIIMASGETTQFRGIYYFTTRSFQVYSRRLLLWQTNKKYFFNKNGEFSQSDETQFEMFNHLTSMCGLMKDSFLLSLYQKFTNSVTRVAFCTDQMWSLVCGVLLERFWHTQPQRLLTCKLSNSFIVTAEEKRTGV